MSATPSVVDDAVCPPVLLKELDQDELTVVQGHMRLRLGLLNGDVRVQVQRADGSYTFGTVSKGQSGTLSVSMDQP